MNFEARRQAVLDRMDDNSLLILYSGQPVHISADAYYECESRVEFSKSNGKHRKRNTAKDMQEQALRRAHFGSGLNIRQVAKPIEERFDGLPHRTYKCRHGIPSEQCVAALLLSGCPNLHSILFF